MIEHNDDILTELRRVADALEHLTKTGTPPVLEKKHFAYVWHTNPDHLQPVPKVNHIPLTLLQGIDHQSDILYENTRRFANGLSANNALLWGARGTGKSSLVKAIHLDIAKTSDITLIEIHREDLDSLPRLLSCLNLYKNRRFIVFCDDLAFEAAETSYKSLKAVLEGGIEGKPEHVIFYATSNRRHLMARDMIDNERSTAINPSEAVDEKVSLSDRFGLWLGFHNVDQDTYLAMINAYADAIHLDSDAQKEKNCIIRLWHGQSPVAVVRGGSHGNSSPMPRVKPE